MFILHRLIIKNLQKNLIFSPNFNIEIYWKCIDRSVHRIEVNRKVLMLQNKFNLTWIRIQSQSTWLVQLKKKEEKRREKKKKHDVHSMLIINRVLHFIIHTKINTMYMHQKCVSTKRGEVHIRSTMFCQGPSRSATIKDVQCKKSFSGDRRPTSQRQSTGGSWPPGKFFIKQRGDFPTGGQTTNLFLKIWASLHQHPVVVL